ncbi:sarcosine oxidase subunit gamma [Acetobacter peroxydans]|jgi:sarcosine oxidase subunit gamma|uniref:sarcosine oxidase subunit gamma n=1 Tax=Acetobacter peroxydans TaxID=104098 RepID=UPI002352B95E|nr:sarcosine oxidase subunit gamma family protein [Acetobacter peroxydans]MCH4144155.1 sarcosine oxidase subunit gamma [Acetobacter peroxydans]MCI1410967.1 sarcosine oxidase subunit gamma [Acetobacter peroxydans]MCI1440496.1 sarcosine oxidase subunit gamma [Acetobacter peroxydans]MCI1566226.1 sarcosine oxidase subunit gamma [Acetobacter peroxydans]MCI1619097.1 sarcosine oxidase subunit gamma [Acetobacter peroxydans]
MAESNVDLAGFDLVAGPSLTRWVFQGREAAMQAACAAVGCAVPDMLAVTQAEGATALRLGPYEVLFLLELAVARGVSAAWAGALAGVAHSLVEVTARQGALSVSGPRAAEVLGCLSPLDFAPGSFVPGTATRTLLDKADGMIWRQAEDRFHLEVWTSFLPYVTAMLKNAAHDTRF